MIALCRPVETAATIVEPAARDSAQQAQRHRPSRFGIQPFTPQTRLAGKTWAAGSEIVLHGEPRSFGSERDIPEGDQFARKAGDASSRPSLRGAGHACFAGQAASPRRQGK